MVNILQMKTKYNNPCRKIKYRKPTDSDMTFTYPSAEYADTHTANPYGDVSRYLRDVEKHFAGNLEGIKRELWTFKGMYAKQYHWFSNSIIQTDLRDRRKNWCKGAIDYVNNYAKTNDIVF